MEDNWIIENLQNALSKWDEKMREIWELVTTSPEAFKGGSIWDVIVSINGAITAIGLALLVLFFLVGLIKTSGSFADVKRPEILVKLFIRFILAKAVITYGLELMMTLLGVVQGVIATVMNTAGFSNSSETIIPDEIVESVDKLSFLASIPLWAITLIGGIVITVLSFIMLLTVYGRFFKLYLFSAIAPIPLASFAGEPTQNIGISFLKSYSAVCLEGAVIVLSCIIFSLFASAPPIVDADASAVTQVWSYIGEIIFTMLILVGSVKMSDRLVREMFFGG